MENIQKYESYCIKESTHASYENIPKKFRDELTRPGKERFQKMNQQEIYDLLPILLRIDHLCKNHNYNWSDLAKMGGISKFSNMKTGEISKILGRWYLFLIDKILFRDFDDSIDPIWNVPRIPSDPPSSYQYY